MQRPLSFNHVANFFNVLFLVILVDRDKLENHQEQLERRVLLQDYVLREENRESGRAEVSDNPQPEEQRLLPQPPVQLK